jgi:hypothetical protein
MRQRYALAVWMLYWISYLLPTASRSYSAGVFGPRPSTDVYEGWYAAHHALMISLGFLRPEFWSEVDADSFCNSFFSLLYTLNNILMFCAYLFVRRAPTRFQTGLFVLAGAVNLTAAVMYPVYVLIGFYLWVAVFFLMAIALRKPIVGRPLQFSLATLFFTPIAGLAVVFPLTTDQRGPEWRAGYAIGVVLLIILPAVVLLQDILRERRTRNS